MTNRSRYPLLLAACLIAISATRTEAAEIFDLTAAEDAFVSSSHATSNYGGAGGLAVSAPGQSNGEFQSVLRFQTVAARNAFDAAFGAENWTIQTIELRLSVTSPNNAIFNTQAAGRVEARWMADDAWIEGAGSPNAPSPTGITFNTLPDYISPSDVSLGFFNFDGSTSGSLSAMLNADPVLTQDVMADTSLSLRLLAADSAVSMVFNSRNYSNAASRPYLHITAVPEPTTGLLSMAALALVLYRRGLGASRRTGKCI